MKTPILMLAICLTATAIAQPPNLTNAGLKPPAIVNCTPVKDQSMSGTCWSFSSNSFLESEMLRNRKETLDLSEMFVARYSYVRKVETWLKNKGVTFFTPGGQFHDVVWVMRHHGSVPEAVYNGRPGGETAHDHALLDTAIKHYTEGLLANKVYALSPGHYAWLDSVLNHHLGVVPAQFNYAGKSYTPQTFVTDYLHINPEDFVEITSYTHHPFYKAFVLEDKYNWTGDAYYNVPLTDFIAITDSALKKGFTVGWDGDVDEPGFDFYGGWAYLPQKTVRRQQQRQAAFKDGSTDIDHMMHVVALVKDSKGAVWYYVKNSWGAANAYKGYLFMSLDYFAIKTSAIIVNKNAIPTAIRQKLGF
jgi:bleomycin hydrolase